METTHWGNFEDQESDFSEMGESFLDLLSGGWSLHQHRNFLQSRPLFLLNHRILKEFFLQATQCSLRRLGLSHCLQKKFRRVILQPEAFEMLKMQRAHPIIVELLMPSRFSTFKKKRKQRKAKKEKTFDPPSSDKRFPARNPNTFFFFFVSIALPLIDEEGDKIGDMMGDFSGDIKPGGAS